MSKTLSGLDNENWGYMLYFYIQDILPQLQVVLECRTVIQLTPVSRCRHSDMIVMILWPVPIPCKNMWHHAILDHG